MVWFISSGFHRVEYDSTGNTFQNRSLCSLTIRSALEVYNKKIIAWVLFPFFGLLPALISQRRVSDSLDQVVTARHFLTKSDKFLRDLDQTILVLCLGIKSTICWQGVILFDQ